MAQNPTSDPKAQAAIFAKYVADKRILIADPNATSRASIAQNLHALGAKTSNIVMVTSFQAAEEEIAKSKPKIVIVDYTLGKRCGLDLLQNQRAHYPDLKDSLFVLVTGNNSQSAVAKAAEEDIDTYIIKPFTTGVFRDSIIRATIRKIEPTEYMKVIDRGKKELAEAKLDEAIKTFEYAKTLDKTPSLAFFYLGQAEDMKKLMEKAEKKYSEGLAFNKIHYKCMVGLYENLVLRKKHTEAYDIIKRISQYFPANPQRLTAVLRLAIFTQSYEDVERYYQIFTNIDERNDEMVKYVCAALVICGKYYIQQKHGVRALELFQKAAVTASGRTMILREIIQALVDCGMGKKADEFLKRFPPATQKGADYLTMNLLLLNETGPGSLVVEKGRELLTLGIHDPVIYKIMIARSIDANIRHAAEDLVEQAEKRWPEKKDVFRKLLSPKAAAGSTVSSAASPKSPAAVAAKSPAKA